jgi:hypothetical protein
VTLLAFSEMAPGQARISLEQQVEDGLRPDSNGSSNQRDLAKLRALSYGGVVQKEYAFDVHCSVRLLWQHMYKHLTPLRQTALFLVVYVIARQCSFKGQSVLTTPVSFQGGEVTIEEYNSILDVFNPVSGYRLREVITNLHLHPVYKDQGNDQFFNDAQEWWSGQTSKRNSLTMKAHILLTALFFLAVRSERVLKYLRGNVEFLLCDFDSYCTLWKAVCEGRSPFIGLKDGDRAKRSQHTSEQKTWGAGHLLDILLQPC